MSQEAEVSKEEKLAAAASGSRPRKGKQVLKAGLVNDNNEVCNHAFAAAGYFGLVSHDPAPWVMSCLGTDLQAGPNWSGQQAPSAS